ncbi:MAG: tetratricopeptide repeat protein [Candidatus Zixiibacteriota bacterium]
MLIGMGILAAIEILSSLSPGLHSWGLDFWSEVPLSARLLAFGLLLFALAPPVAGVIDNALREFLRRPAGFFTMLAVALVLFLVFRSRGYAYGDGYSFPAYFIGGSLPEFTDHHWTMALDLVSHWALYRFVMMPLGGSVEWTYAILGAVGGVASLIAIIRIARMATSDRVIRAFMLAAGTASAVVVFWFGHMESYTLVNATLLWVLVFAIEAQEKPHRIWTAWGMWVLAVAFHQLAVAAIPVLLFAHWRSRRAERVVLPDAKAWVLLGAGFLGWAAATFAYRLIGPPIFVPILATSDSGYSAFSLAHLIDMANLLIFVAPLAVFAFAEVMAKPPESEAAKPGVTALLAVASASLWYFAFWVDPLLGAFRDWDLLCAFGIPLSLWAALAMASRVPKGGVPRWLWVPVAAFALFHCGGYISTLQNEQKAALRVDRLVGVDPHYGAEFFRGTRLPPWAAIVGRVLDRYDLAREHLRRRVQYDPNDGLAWANLGNAFQKLGIYDSGAVAYKQALIREPQNEKYANNLGILYSMQNKTLEARDAFETAAALSDSSYGSRTMLGLIYLQTGQFELSRKALEEAIALKPSEFGAYYHRALYYESQYDTTRAIVDYEAAIARGGNDEEIFRRLVQLCQFSGRIPQALNACNRWARLFPNSVDPYFLAGTSYIMASKFDSAGMYLTEARTRAPGSGLIAYYLATALRESGQPDRAREVAMQATTLDTTLALPWLELVYLAADAGDTPAAVAATHEFLRRSPGDSGMSYLQPYIRRR